LRELQGRFGAALRAPIMRGDAAIPAASVRYAPELLKEIAPSPILDARAQVGVYNRQYWFRLFGTLQTEYALTARLVGFAAFNGLAQRYLLAQPPRGHDLHDVGTAFAEFLAGDAARGHGELAGVPREAAREAAAIDLAFRQLLYAPSEAAYRPSAAEAGALTGARLRASRRWAIVEERWPLVELKRGLGAVEGEARVALPARLPAPQCWLLYNTAAGAMSAAVVPALAARLFLLLARTSVGEALACVEQECPEARREALPGDVQRWLAQSVELGFWTGRDAPTPT
jgi:hypothetical protein